MASIVEHTTRNGTHFKVRFRQGPKQRSISFATREAAENWLNVLSAVGSARALEYLDQDRVEELNPRELVVPWVTRHVDALSGITSGTRSGYHSITRLSIEPFFAGMPLDLVDEDAVRRWVTWMHETQHHSTKTIRNRHSLLSAALESAHRAGKIKNNPAKGTRLPRTLDKDEHVYLTRWEFELLLECIDPYYRPFVFTAIATGLRFGEITALQVKHIDFENSSIHIRQAWKSGSPAVLGPPKTPKSRRTIAGPEDVFRVLHAVCAGRGPEGFVFTNKSGEPIKRSTFFRNVWEPARCRFAGDTTKNAKDPTTGRYKLQVIERGPGKHPRVHDLRHTYASWAIQAGIPLPVLQRQLGHESIQTTVDTYGHLARSDFDALAAATAQNLPSLSGQLGRFSTTPPPRLSA